MIGGGQAADFVYQYPDRTGMALHVRRRHPRRAGSGRRPSPTGFARTVADRGRLAPASYTEREATAPWTRPANEFVVGFGMFTAAEFALIARRHMHVYGTTPESLATVAATIRNNGHVNPEAVYYGRGPFTPEDILASRMVADPFHLLDCAMTSEGGCGAGADPRRPGRGSGRSRRSTCSAASTDYFGPAYQHPPSFDLGGDGAPT